MSDKVVLLVGEWSFVCNKNELKERSEYFRAMFSHDFIETGQEKIVLKDVDGEAFQFILDGEIPATDMQVDSILSALRVSSMLQFDAEAEKYETYILSDCLYKHPLRIMAGACGMDRTTLYEKSLAYCLWHFEDLLTSQDFAHVPYSCFLSYLDHDGLRVGKGEIEVFKCIEQWSIPNEPTEDQLIKLLTTIRFKQLKLEEIEEISRSSLFLNSDSLSNTIINIIMARNQGLSCENNHAGSNSFFCKKSRKFCAMPCTVIPFNSLDSGKNKTFPAVYGLNGEDFVNILYLNHRPFSDNFIGFKMISVGFKLYLFGGEHGYGTGMFNMGVWSYDLISEMWNYECQISQQRRHFSLTVLNDCVFLFGGTGRYRKVLRSIEKFNMKTKAWSVCSKLSNVSFAPAVCSYDNKIYVVGDCGKPFYEYDPCDNIFNYIPVELQKVSRVRFITIYQDYLYAVQASCAAIYRWKIFNNPDPLFQSECLGCFRHEGESVLVHDTIYHFIYIDDDSQCYIETLNLNDLRIQLVSSYSYKSSRDSQYIFNGAFMIPNYF